MKDRFDEYQRLANVYRDFGDVELLDLARQMNDLTDVAQQVLQGEISSRRLEVPKPGKQPTAEGSADAEENAQSASLNLGSFAHLSSRDCIWEFAEAEDAQAAAEMLRDAGIGCDLIVPGVDGGDKFDMGTPKLAVMPDDVGRARQLLSEPIPEEFRVLVRTRDQFIVPTCPKCGAPDPLLESIEPTNQWKCEACSHTWSDSSAF